MTATTKPSWPDYAERWEIAIRPGGLNIVTATQRSADRRHIRSLAARSAPELADLIAAVEAENES